MGATAPGTERVPLPAVGFDDDQRLELEPEPCDPDDAELCDAELCDAELRDAEPASVPAGFMRWMSQFCFAP